MIRGADGPPGWAAAGAVDGEDEASPAQWFWFTMSEPVPDEKLAELFDWVETLLRTQHPDYLATRSNPAGPTTPKHDGNSPGSTSSGPSPT